MKFVFMGTPDFSVGIFNKLVDAGNECLAVITQPDKPKGRGHEVQFTPVKEAAIAKNIPVLQPAKVSEEGFANELQKLGADVFVVAAFGQILKKNILEMPKYGCINVHASLLPKYRGASPIQWAVINGEPVSGVTTMQMGEGLDTGDILLKEEVILAEDETGGSLFDKLSEVGADLAVKTLKALEDGSITPIPQDDSLATYTGKIDKTFGNIDWNKPAKELEQLIRGLNPWPSAYSKLSGKTLKIWKARVLEEEDKSAAGTVVSVSKNSFVVSCGLGALEILELQLEGKKRMDTAAFLRGYSLEAGTKLG
ncbi:MAG: methionyl-tRNA formyltransferase [Lachnospiraceae bacterium]|jgi:methionyl-tRNA formyltransferase|nr:methionyl-tRNA formyltransferase [Lachnospiraceae bacterium]